jgi:hypothetical protein
VNSTPYTYVQPPRDLAAVRAQALAAAAVLHAPRFGAARAAGRHQDDGDEAVLTTANRLAAWLLGPVTLQLIPGQVTTQGSPAHPRHYHHTEGMTMQIADNDDIVFTVNAEDSKHFPVVDPCTFTTDDPNGAVATLVPAADGMSVTLKAVAPGTVNLTCTDGRISGTEAIVVTVGPVASLVMTAGTPTPQA